MKCLFFIFRRKSISCCRWTHNSQVAVCSNTAAHTLHGRFFNDTTVIYEKHSSANMNNNMQKAPCGCALQTRWSRSLYHAAYPYPSLPPSIIPFPNINIHGATGVWRAECIEPTTRCRDGGWKTPPIHHHRRHRHRHRHHLIRGWWRKKGRGGWSAAVKVAQCGIVGKVSDQGATSLDIYHNYYCRSLTGTEIKCAVTGPHAHAGRVGKARASEESRSALLMYVSKIVVFQPHWQNKRPPSSAVPWEQITCYPKMVNMPPSWSLVELL